MIVNSVQNGYGYQSPTILSLPNEVLENIFNFIDFKSDQDSLNLVCRHFYNVTLESCKRVELAAYKNFIQLFEKKPALEKKILILEHLILKADNFINLRVFFGEIELLLFKDLNGLVKPKTPFDRRKLSSMIVVRTAKELVESWSRSSTTLDDQLTKVFNQLFMWEYKQLALELSSFFLDPKKRDALPYIYIMSLIKREKIDEAWEKANQIKRLTNKFRCLDLVREGYQNKKDFAGVTKVNRVMSFLPAKFDKLLERTKFVNTIKALEYASLAKKRELVNSHLFDMALGACSSNSLEFHLILDMIRPINCPNLKNSICSLTIRKLLSLKQNDLAFEIAQLMDINLSDLSFFSISVAYAKDDEFDKAIAIASKIKCIEKSSVAFVDISDLLLKKEQFLLSVEVLLKIENKILSKFVKLDYIFCLLANKEKIALIINLFQQFSFPEHLRARLLESVVKELCTSQRSRLAYGLLLSTPIRQVTPVALARTAYTFYKSGNLPEASKIININPSNYKNIFYEILRIALDCDSLTDVLQLVRSLGDKNYFDKFIKFISGDLYLNGRYSKAVNVAFLMVDEIKRNLYLALLAKKLFRNKDLSSYKRAVAGITDPVFRALFENDNLPPM